MNNIVIEEIREALKEAKYECESAESNADDVKGYASDAKDAAGSAVDAAYESKEKVERAIELLDGWEEDQAEKINSDDVTSFLKQQRSIILTLSRALLSMDTTITNFAKYHDLNVPSLNEAEAASEEVSGE